MKNYIIITVIVVNIVAIGVYYYMSNKVYETTDNALIEGNIESVKSGVSGYVQEIRFNDNQTIQKGDTLIVLDTIALTAKLKQAEAALEQAKANKEISKLKFHSNLQQINKYENDILAREQNIVVSRANLEKAQKNYNRIKELLNQKGTTQQNFEDATNQLEICKANYEQTLEEQKSLHSTLEAEKTNTESGNSEISANAALIKQKEAELELAQQELKHAFIIAPFNGIATKRAVQYGQYISTGQTLLALVDNRNFWVVANFKETQLAKMKTGQRVKISIDAIPTLKLEGAVESFAGATGAKFSLLPPDNATGNFTKIVQRIPVRIKINDVPSTEKEKLFPGLSVSVRINTDQQ